MRDPQVFRELASQFRALQQSHDPHEEMHAVYFERTDDRDAEFFGSSARLRIQERNVDAAAKNARAAGHAGLLVLAGASEHREYVLSGGPSDSATRQSLWNQWSALATKAAVAAGLGASNVNEARAAWLDILRRRCSHYVDDGGYGDDRIISRLCTGSAELCLVLEGEAALESAMNVRADGTPGRQGSRIADEREAESTSKIESTAQQTAGNDERKPAVYLPANASSALRQNAVEMFRNEVAAATGQRPPKSAIWRAAHYKSRTDFERWVRNSKSTKAADERFRRVLSEKLRLTDRK